MYETFKINAYFDEKGEEIEDLVSRFLIQIVLIQHSKEEQCLNK